MTNALIFKKIKNETIFTSGWETFEKNNVLDFSQKSITVLYGPNGTGKTSLVNVLSGNGDTEILVEFNATDYSSPSELFHIINDQNSRNIIRGNTEDFVLGDNISKERELKKYLDKECKELYDQCKKFLKDDFKIATKENPLIGIIQNTHLKALVQKIGNRSSKATDISSFEFCALLGNIKSSKLPDDNSGELKSELEFFIEDFHSKESIIKNVLTMKLLENPNVREVEENDEAEKILRRFRHKDQCIVCDNDHIDPEKLILKKRKNREEILSKMDKETRQFLEKLFNDPTLSDEATSGKTLSKSKIKKDVLDSIDTGDFSKIEELKKRIHELEEIFSCNIEEKFYQLLSGSELKKKNKEYEEMLANRLVFEEEDFLYIEEIIKSSMEKEIRLDRDADNNIKIMLAEKSGEISNEIVGCDRAEMPLSTGEQNFLSLTFEFLKAKKSSCEFIVIDDPVSSFDSIYKNKVTFAILKMLEKKQRILLTHNLDLIRLLDGQQKNSYELYLLNNTEEEENGFIPFNSKEKDMVIYLDKLLKTFRETIFSPANNVRNVNLFLISMIPFMRGYAGLIKDDCSKNKLTKIMHGYMNEKVDIAAIYNKLFSPQNPTPEPRIIPESFQVNVEDILLLDIGNMEILDKEVFPLLNKTLRHSLTYLYLRLLVEKTLVEKYPEATRDCDQLGKIIDKSFPNRDDLDELKKRVFLNSRKTLLNEFNHFEGNLSIFQPAIDITDRSLKKEKDDIIAFLNSL